MSVNLVLGKHVIDCIILACMRKVLSLHCQPCHIIHRRITFFFFLACVRDSVGLHYCGDKASCTVVRVFVVPVLVTFFQDACCLSVMHLIQCTVIF